MMHHSSSFSSDALDRHDEARCPSPGSPDWHGKLVAALTAVQGHLVGPLRAGPLFEELLAALLKLTGSGYGFIGEAREDEAGSPFLRVHAVTSVDWDEDTKRLGEESVRRSLEAPDPDALHGRVLASGEAVFLNAAATEAPLRGLPGDHPSLRGLLGVPLRAGGVTVGMVGLANRPEAYDAEIVEALDPLLRTCANSIVAFRSEIERRKAEGAWRAERSTMQAMLEGVREGIVTVDEHGLIQSVNAALARMFGYEAQSLRGRRIESLMPEAGGGEHEGLRPKFAEPLHPNASAMGREVGARRRDGAFFPVCLRVAEVRIENRRLFTAVVHDLSKQPEAEHQEHGLPAELARSRCGRMIGRSCAMRRVYETIDLVADGDWPVLIEGETGSRKELVARAIHAGSRRRRGPFVATNTAGLANEIAVSQLFGHRRGAFTGATRDQKGLFESAEGGTLFLDEIGAVSQTVQLALLRALEEREIVRVGDTLPRKVDVRSL